MIKIEALLGKELYKTTIHSTSGNKVIADEPLDKGGQDLGFSPKELLIASLAACTGITVRMYANHKKWDLTDVKVTIELIQDESGKINTMTREITLLGNLSEEQKTRILTVANACPVHKILSNPIEITTNLI